VTEDGRKYGEVGCTCEFEPVEEKDDKEDIEDQRDGEDTALEVSRV